MICTDCGRDLSAIPEVYLDFVHNRPDGSPCATLEDLVGADAAAKFQAMIDVLVRRFLENYEAAIM